MNKEIVLAIIVGVCFIVLLAFYVIANISAARSRAKSFERKIAAQDQRAIFDQIVLERLRQDAKWGANRRKPNSYWLPILTEELGEVAAAMQGDGNLQNELIQVAAVAVCWLEGLGADVSFLSPDNK